MSKFYLVLDEEVVAYLEGYKPARGDRLVAFKKVYEVLEVFVHYGEPDMGYLMQSDMQVFVKKIGKISK